MRFGFGAVVLALGLGLPASAHAVERQHHLAVGPTVSILKVDRLAGMTLGAGATALYTYGLNDQFNLDAELSHAWLGLGRELETSTAPANRPGFDSRAAVGVSYVLDVLRWVPYGGVHLAGNVLGGGTLTQPVFAPAAEIAVGLDYQFSRHLAAGVGYRQHVLFTKLSDYPFFGSGLVKLEWQWGY